MPDLFISYKREDQDKARLLARALESRGWSVWWDPELRAGDDFEDVIEETIKNVKCVIVLWSNRSITSKHVKDEARLARKLQKLVPVALDEADPPFGFEGLHTIQLQGWDGSDSSVFQKLVKDIEAKAGRPAARTQNTPAFDLSDLLKPAEPATVSADEIGADSRELMEIHRGLMKADEALREKFPFRASFGLLATRPAYGRITRDELAEFVGRPQIPDLSHVSRKQKNLAKYRAGERLRKAREALALMDARKAEAIDYMPAQLKDLPAHLKKRAVEVLLSDGLAGVTLGTLGRPFEITGVMLSSYHMSHDSPEVSHELKLIADYFGWQIWGLS